LISATRFTSVITFF